MSRTVEVAVPVAEHEEHELPAIKLSDFARHRDEIVYRVLGEEGGRLLVTAHGYPDFVLAEPGAEGWEKVEYDETLAGPDGRPHAVERHTGGGVRTRFVRVTAFWRHRGYLTARALPSWRRVVVTRFGWPTFTVEQYEGPSDVRVSYPEVVSEEERMAAIGRGPGEEEEA